MIGRASGFIEQSFKWDHQWH